LKLILRNCKEITGRFKLYSEHFLKIYNTKEQKNVIEK